jgi:acetylornithine deacetylase/succinyl-diaminopimelate desuccinylase-like protein
LISRTREIETSGGQNSRLTQFIKIHRLQFESMLQELVEIPTVSADSNRKSEFQRAAVLSSEFLRKFGAKVTSHNTDGHPILVGEFGGSNEFKSLTIYNHLDVQPAQEAEWKTKPFKFLKKNGKYFGRGTTDDKGPALTALFAAAFAQQEKIPLKIRFLWEMEEEIGSPHFESFIRSHRKSVQSDSILVIDSIWISPERPTIYYALRGNITGTMFLETAYNDVHSGIVGGVARNPMAELIDVASRIQDAKTGRIKIPGFYKDVRPIRRQELRNFRQLQFDLPGWTKAYGLKRIRKTNTIEALVRTWCKPTFEIHGMPGGYTGQGVKTAIPPRAELKWSARLVPDQDPEEMSNLIQRFIRHHNPDIEVRIHSKLSPYIGSLTGSYAAAGADAFKFGFSGNPAFARAGGSDGAVAIMQKYLKVPIVLMGLSLPEHGYHAPNEHFDWEQASGGMRTFVNYFDRISKI